MATQELSHYQGAYTIELEPGTPTHKLPRGADVGRDNVVSVPRGSLYQSMGGIQFYANGAPFSVGYKYLRRIKDADGKVLWQNRNLKD